MGNYWDDSSSERGDTFTSATIYTWIHLHGDSGMLKMVCEMGTPTEHIPRADMEHQAGQVNSTGPFQRLMIYIMHGVSRLATVWRSCGALCLHYVRLSLRWQLYRLQSQGTGTSLQHCNDNKYDYI